MTLAQRILFISFSCVIFSACAMTKCNTIGEDGRLKDATCVQAERAAAEKAAKEKEEADAKKPLAPPTSVFVYKYDNSRQCGKTGATSLEEMAKEFRKIKILSQEKRNDGMMRIQMCGAPSGNANVYEIAIKDLKKAVKIGFREWKFPKSQ